MNEMQGEIQTKIIKRQECKCLLQRIGFYLDMAQAIVYNHGYDTDKKLSRLKPDNIDILCKTIRSPGGEQKDGTRDPGINVPHLAQCALTSAYFVLYHCECYNLCPMLNTITHDNVYD